MNSIESIAKAESASFAAVFNLSGRKLNKELTDRGQLRRSAAKNQVDRTDGSFGPVGIYKCECAMTIRHALAGKTARGFLELRRITKPGGRLYITIHDRHTVDLIMNHPEKVYDTGDRVYDPLRNLILSHDQKENFSKSDFCMFTIHRGPGSQVFYDVDYLRRHWGRMLNIRSVIPEAYGYQTAIVLEK